MCLLKELQLEVKGEVGLQCRELLLFELFNYERRRLGLLLDSPQLPLHLLLRLLCLE